MKKLQLYLLESTLEKIPETWKMQNEIEFTYSDVMKSLYLTDFPNAWAEDEMKKCIGTIGANDYFNKWTGKEFDILEDTPLNKFYEKVDDEIAKGSIINTKKTGIPLSAGNHQILFYNKKYVRKEPETFKELIEMSEQIKKEYGLEYSFILPTSACYFILPMLYGFGADLWNHEGEDPISKEALKKIIVLLRDLMYERKILPIKWEQEDSVPYFMSGKAAFCIGGDWNIKQFDESTGHNLGMCEIPRLERECRSNANANYLFLSNQLDEELYKNAEDLCEKVLSEEVQTQLLKELYRMPVTKDYKMDITQFDELTVKSYEIYKNAFVLPPLIDVSHMYHVLGDLLERDVVTSEPEDVLAEKFHEKLKEADKYYNKTEE
jgi:maltose-binding protein MalE